eukprot:3312583-Amphidinium_carterae.1
MVMPPEFASQFTPYSASHSTRLHAHRHRLSSAMLFIDVGAAYDKVLRQLLLPPETDSPQLLHGLEQLGLCHETARRTLAYVRQHPACLLNIGLSPQLTSTLRSWDSWLHSNWLVTHHDAHAVLEPPGEHKSGCSIQARHVSSVHSSCSPVTLVTRTGVMQ